MAACGLQVLDTAKTVGRHIALASSKLGFLDFQLFDYESDFVGEGAERGELVRALARLQSRHAV